MRHPAFAVAVLLAGSPVAAGADAATEGPYVKRATWQETLRASLDAARRPGAATEAPRLPDFGRDDFTVMAWVKTTADGTIFSKVPAGTAPWARDAKALFVRDGRLGYDLGWVDCVAGRRAVNDGQWHHVALTGPGSIELFVDGEPDARGTLAGGPDPAGFVVRIGRASPDFPKPSAFQGAIDEVRVFARRLTAAEIQAQSRKPAEGAVASWPFDGGAADGPGNRFGTAVRGSAAYAEGRLGKALILDGRTHVELAAPGADPAPAAALPPGLWGRLRRDFPDLAADFDRIVCVKRLTYNANHYYTEYINAGWMPGGSLCVLDLNDGSVRDLAPSLQGGVFERIDLSFDARRVVFAWKGHPQQGYRIYEVGVDGTGLRPLTFPAPDEEALVRTYRVDPAYHHGTDDMQPCYLPDGGIAFISTRCQFGILCDAPDNFTTTVLYRMDGDGKNLQKLTNSSVSEASPVALSDGRILYTRWEYVDKGAVSVKCLWVMRPDGSASAEVYGNDIALPPTLIYGRPIPGTADQYVVLGAPHCPQNGVGTVIRLDMSKNIRTREPMTYLTPGVDIQAEPGFAFRSGTGPWRHDASGRSGPLFKDPYPLSRSAFLVSHKPEGLAWDDPRGYGIALLDETGAVFPVHRDPAVSTWVPIPLRPRPVPPVLPSTLDPELARTGKAVCVVHDVYHGLKDVPRGAIRFIRVLEQVPRPWAVRYAGGGDLYDQQYKCVTKDTHLGLKVQHGVVPVEDDGSAHFVVPADANIFLQALDEDYRAVQTERTYVNYRPGERRSCVGCHEIPSDVPRPLSGTSRKALQRAPSVPGPQPGEAAGGRALDYAQDVQPVWDRHCVRCHGGERTDGGLDLRGTPTELFSVSYESLVPERRKGHRDRGLLGPVIGENHPKTGNVEYLPARSLGSHASVLVALLSQGTVRLPDPAQAARVRKLLESHTDVDVTREERIRVANWVDTNAQYYGTYWGRRNLQCRGLPDFRPAATFEMARSTAPPAPDERKGPEPRPVDIR